MMPSVMTLEGDHSDTPHIGDCKEVKNSRTGCTMLLCYVGKGKSKTGWRFKKGSSVCRNKK